ncbi:unnamed protein product [Toxocara canis]|uniref:Glyco_hydro_2 domain-containing protein n=1 Tax=Toxocara canis TaxID=6265 RepID=A0A183U4W7_TOXCA|nr:unnamed protein product [Toxocara canis]
MVNSNGASYQETVVVTARNENGAVIFENEGSHFRGFIENVRPWWPRGMGTPTLYQLEIRLLNGRVPIDIYRIQFGFRTVSFTNDEIYINGRPFYCRGFGMHEDFEVFLKVFRLFFLITDYDTLWFSVLYASIIASYLMRQAKEQQYVKKF